MRRFIEFLRQTVRYFAGAARGLGELTRELLYYMADNKRWWLGPILFVMLLLSILLAITASPLGAAFYAIF